jgi:predicted alpha/beta-fold hydrolase
VVDDLDFVIKHASIHFKEIYLMGFSLGGNLTLNYLGRLGHKLQNSNIKKAVAFSVPCHLESCALNMARLKNRIYLKRFLKSLKAKIKDKAAIMPDKLNTDQLEKIKDFIDFDDLYTGPLHGFKDARDYYKQCSSLFVVEHIAIPTLLVNAKNDPFLSDESFPYKEAISSSYFYFEAPTSGGHCGFITFGTKLNWAESRAIEFLLAEN